MFERIKKGLNNKKNINSLLIAILCMAGLISFIININNIIPIIVVVVFIVAEIVNYNDFLKKIKSKEINIKNNLISFILLIAVLIFFVITIANKGMKETVMQRLFYFCGFIIIPYLCCRHEISVNKVVNYILIISGIIAIPMFFVEWGEFSAGDRMAISYYMLPIFLAMIMNFFVDNNKSLKKNFGKIIIFLTLFYPYNDFLVKYISRGVILAIVICIILCSIMKKSLKIKLTTIVFIILIAIVVGVFLIKPILYFTESLLSNFNIRAEVISKSLDLIENGKFDNGRNKVFEQAINGIKEHPILGNGIGDYAEKYVTYPHNILLQAWYEGGIVFFILMSFILIYSLYIFIFDKNIDLEKKYLLILFFSIAIVRLMLSYEFWRETSFGLYLYIVLDAMQKKLNIRRNKKNGNSNYSNI